MALTPRQMAEELLAPHRFFHVDGNEHYPSRRDTHKDGDYVSAYDMLDILEAHIKALQVLQNSVDPKEQD